MKTNQTTVKRINRTVCLFLLLLLALSAVSCGEQEVMGEDYEFERVEIAWKEDVTDAEKMTVYMTYGVADEEALLKRITEANKGTSIEFRENGTYLFATASGAAYEGDFVQDGKTVRCTGRGDGLHRFDISVRGEDELVMQADVQKILFMTVVYD